MEENFPWFCIGRSDGDDHWLQRNARYRHWSCNDLRNLYGNQEKRRFTAISVPALWNHLHCTHHIADRILDEGSGIGAMATGGSGKFILLLFAGIASAVPMGLFSAAARNLPLLTLGLTSYISPSIALVLGIFLFKEPFDIIQFSAFAIIWVGLIFFTYGELTDIRKEKKE